MSLLVATASRDKRRNTAEPSGGMQSSSGWALILLLLWLPSGNVVADDSSATDDTEVQSEFLEDDGDETQAVETRTTVDYTREETGLLADGDLRPIFTDSDTDSRDGVSSDDDSLGARLRLFADFGITDRLHVGARLAGRCAIDDCDLEFVLEDATPGSSGLKDGQFTFDELYLHWFRTERRSLAVGRLQTRFVLRGGVFAKSLDRNNSNNINVNWTDGLQSTHRARNGWLSNLILQRNARDGTGSIVRGPLDFNDSAARNTYFVGFENSRNVGPIVQRALDVSYLPASLLKDGNPAGRREDYWGFVGRLAFRWPQRAEGIRLRSGTEIGYAPEVPTSAAMNLDADVSGFAWNVVASVLDFQPGHSLGINYARTGAGWLLSPQYRENDELLEIRYMWVPKRFPVFEARVRRREELEQLIGALQKQKEFDMFVRLTWQFPLKEH